MTKRIERLHDAGVLSSDGYEEMRKALRVVKSNADQVLAVLDITPLEFYGQRVEDMRCIVDRHDFKKLTTIWEMRRKRVMGDPRHFRCDRCGASKKVTLDCHGRVMWSHIDYPPNRVGPGRTLTKWEKDSLEDYIDLEDEVRKLEEKLVRKSGRRHPSVAG